MLGSGVAVAAPAAAATSSGVPRSAARPATVAQDCPWASASFDAAHTPAQLAAIVLPHMTLADKLGLVDLSTWHGYENRTQPIKSLCIPALTLEDGPNGLAFNDTGVTQLPSSLGVAATFDTAIARQYGAVIGNEARRQGIDVVQGPNLNVLRVPQSGRAYEGYGEDPDLVSEMGVADISGIQSEGVMADAKHFTAYNQETDRINLNENVSTRALEEIYLPPFLAAVTRGNVASVMCSYGSINLVSDCADPMLYHLLYGAWGFKGFVRSDLAAVTDAPGAFAAGMSAIKPGAAAQLTEAINDGTLPMRKLDAAVSRILGEMFAYGLVARPIVGKLHTNVASAAHAKVALEVAERSMVLLRNRDNLLPLSPTRTGSIGVIGADAAGGAMTAGFGGAHVIAPMRSTPLAAIRAATSPQTTIYYAPGGSSTAPADAIPLSRFSIQQNSALIARVALGLGPQVVQSLAGTGTFTSAASLLRHATTTIKEPTGGLYVFSLTSNGDAWLSLGSQPLLSSPGLHARSSWSTATRIQPNTRYVLHLSWYQGKHMTMPTVGVRSVQSPVDAAVEVARRVKVPVIFASDVSAEGSDRASLYLPANENALIDAVAAVNRRTVVVLNTGGAVFMPWISKVAAVVEAWYPGELDGAATAAVLFGKVDPAGHLPVTFPADLAQVPTHLRASFPGTSGTVTYAEGLDVGYRYVESKGATPLFPFGFGLSYTTFSMSDLSVVSSTAGVVASVTVTNTGKRTGTAVPQAYLEFPPASGEPPLQLKAFSTVVLRPGASAVVPLSIPPSAFEAYLPGGWQTVPGTYYLFVGSSSATLPLSIALAAPVPVTVGKPVP